MAPPLQDVFVASSILLSASTYLFDFVSHLVVLMEYFKRYLSLFRHSTRQAASYYEACRSQTMLLTDYFYGLLGLFVISHCLNAILFKLKFKPRDAPLCAAYFLPLIHLYRLSGLLCSTFRCAGVQDLRCPEMNGLYCILGSATESIPFLIAQFCGYLELSRDCIGDMSITFKVSVVASFISVAYNGGGSVQSVAKNAISFRQKTWAGAIGGGFILCATLVRCLTFTNLIVRIRQYMSGQQAVREQDKFGLPNCLTFMLIAASIASNSLHFYSLYSRTSTMRNLRNVRRLMSSISFSYLSMHLGPLYPMISLAGDAQQLGHCSFRRNLIASSMYNLLLDVAIACATHLLGALPNAYLVVFLVAMAGYLGFLAAYIRFDAICGPERPPRCLARCLADGDGGIAEAPDGEDEEKGPLSKGGAQVQMLQLDAERFKPLRAMAMVRVGTWPRSGQDTMQGSLSCWLSDTMIDRG